MAFPFLFLAISLAAGILISSFLTFSLLSWFLALAFSLFLAWLLFFIRKEKATFLFVLFSAFLLGASLYISSSKTFEENSLHKLQISQYADFYGTVYRSPSRGEDRDFLFLKVKKFFFGKKETSLQGNLRLTIPRSSEDPSLCLFSGDKIKVSAQLVHNQSFQNFKTFTLGSYLKSQTIHKRAFTKNRLLVERLEPGKKVSLLRLTSILRHKFQQKIEHHFPSFSGGSVSPQGAVLEALLLGERARMEPTITHSLQKAGLYHLFAISGAHIAIISFFLFSFFKILRIPTRPSFLLIMVFLLFYALLVEGRPSVLRATIMTLAFLVGKLIWTNVNLINTISISAFILLFFNPFHLFSLGFQLTFAATFSIILFFPKIIKFLPKLPFKLSEIFALSLAAQLGVLPLIASSFNRITFSSLILNYAALPLVALIMAFGYIFLPLSFLSPILAHRLAEGLNFIINLLVSSSHLLDRFSIASYRIPTPHTFTVICYFLFLYLLLLPSKIKKQKLILFLCFSAFLAILISYPFSSLSKNLKLTFIDVGQGESILVEFPGKKKMLIDGGGFPEGRFDVGENVVSPFLWRKGIKKINYVVLTHAHPDHLNGLKAIVRNFKIGEYWEACNPSGSEAYKDFKARMAPSLPCRRLFRGETVQEKEVRIDILHPPQGSPQMLTIDNDDSLALRLSYGQSSFLLSGDIGIEAEREILKHCPEIKSQVLKSPHHGSRSSSSKVFLENTAPQIVIISVGRGNRYGFPDQEVLERYKEIGVKVYRTDLHGSVEVTSDGRKFVVRTASGR